MNRKNKTPPSPAKPGRPAESGTGRARSGSGAGSAFLAMLKNRQMRASDAEPEAQPPAAPVRKAVGE